MKSTGIVRKVDELGRIVLPIILKKYEPTCIFCGDGRNVENYRGKNICANCMKELRAGK